MADVLDALENRLDVVENIVFGNNDKDVFYPRGKKETQECLEKLVAVQEKLSTATKNKKRISEIYRRSGDLKKFLDPSYTDDLTLSTQAKEEVILAEEEFLKEQVKRLETLNNLKETLDSEHLKAAPTLSSKFEALSQVQIKQQDETASLTEETQKLLSAYNNIISLVSRQFAQWDEILTKIEAKKMTKD